jgi:hypothetical protein
MTGSSAAEQRAVNSPVAGSIPAPSANTPEEPVVRPPDTVTVESRERPVLYDADARPLYRRIGYR